VTAVEDRFTHEPPPPVAGGEELWRRLATVDPGLLLPVAVHVTRDASLVEQFAPQLSAPVVRLAATATLATEAKDDDASDQVRVQLIELIVDAMTHPDPGGYLTGRDLEERGVYGRLLQFVSGGWLVDREDHGMYLQQAGFEPDEVTPRADAIGDRSLRVAIVGAGMAGIDAAVKAQRRGFDYDIYEAETGIGGLWWSQTYPGVAVDTQSLTYSFSWRLSPNWTRIYPGGQEYHAYLSRTAEEFGVLDHVHLGHTVVSMEWLEQYHQWELTLFVADTAQTKRVRADAVITAAGTLNRPKYPDIEGRDCFAGEQVHTARWRDLPVDGKRLGVVGAGAAAVQVVSSYTSRVEHLTVFQRQPHWVAPNPYGTGETTDNDRWLLENLPYYAQWSRLTALLNVNRFCFETKQVDQAWHEKHPYSVTPGSEKVRQSCLNYIDKVFGLESELGRKVTPTFPFAAKRQVFDPGDFNVGKGYYHALTQPHVDVETTGLSRIVPQGILLTDGRLVELDVIVWATGMTLDYLSQIVVVGRDGVTLGEVWQGNEDPRTYVGGTVPGFPNLFVLDGPNSSVATGGSGHNFSVEVTNHFAFEALTYMLNRGASAIEPTQEAFDRHNSTIDERMQGLLWSVDSSAHGYYRNRAGRIVLVNPFWPGESWRMTRSPDPDTFVLRSLEDTPLVAAQVVTSEVSAR
jgi:cation diffusion facilitator CzcD-associated flavoprotein CzcO